MDSHVPYLCMAMLDQQDNRWENRHTIVVVVSRLIVGRGCIFRRETGAAFEAIWIEALWLVDVLDVTLGPLVV